MVHRTLTEAVSGPISHHSDSGSLSGQPAVNFMVHKVTLGQVFFPVLLFTPASIILPTFHAHSFISSTFVIVSILSRKLKKGRYL